VYLVMLEVPVLANSARVLDPVMALSLIRTLSGSGAGAQSSHGSELDSVIESLSGSFTRGFVLLEELADRNFAGLGALRLRFALWLWVFRVFLR
jgi:hypothetical protein